MWKEYVCHGGHGVAHRQPEGQNLPARMAGGWMARSPLTEATEMDMDGTSNGCDFFPTQSPFLIAGAFRRRLDTRHAVCAVCA